MFRLTLITVQIRDTLHKKNTLCIPCLRDWGFHAKLIFFCIILVLPSCNLGSWIRCTIKCLYWCIEGKVGEFSLGEQVKECFEVAFVELVVGGNYVCCFAIVLIFVRFEGAMESGGESFKVINWSANASHKERQFLWERGVLIM